MPIYNAPLLAVDKKETRRYAGLRGPDTFPEDMLDQACLSARLLAKPRGSWSIYPYCAATATIIADVPFRLAGNYIADHLSSAVEIAVMAVTIGKDPEEAITAHFAKGEYTHGLLLDAAGSAAVETIADSINTIIASQAAHRGLTAVRRYSPGYGDWQITDQRQILNLAEGQRIDVDISESCMLQPRKSVTAVVGLTPAKTPPPTADSGGCKACTLITCLARKEIY